MNGNDSPVLSRLKFEEFPMQFSETGLWMKKRRPLEGKDSDKTTGPMTNSPTGLNDRRSISKNF
jgi:hypothetical protein